MSMQARRVPTAARRVSISGSHSATQTADVTWCKRAATAEAARGPLAVANSVTIRHAPRRLKETREVPDDAAIHSSACASSVSVASVAADPAARTAWPRVLTANASSSGKVALWTAARSSLQKRAALVPTRDHSLTSMSSLTSASPPRRRDVSDELSASASRRRMAAEPARSYICRTRRAADWRTLVERWPSAWSEASSSRLDAI
eukprot:scaffold161752_cov32-Tisochrysis_lutea.AAC.7